MKKKIIIGIFVIFMLLGGWYLIALNNAKAMLQEYHQLNNELNSTITKMEKNIEDKDVVGLQVNIVDAQIKTDRLVQLVEKHRTSSIRISNADDLLEKLSKVQKGLDYMENGITSKDDTLLIQGVAILKSVK